MPETRTVGGIQIEVGGDSSKLLAELDRDDKALSSFRAKASGAASGVGALAQASEGNGQALNRMREKLSRTQGAFGQLSMAMGQTTGAAKYAQQGFGLMATSMGAAGPVGIAIAAAAGLMAVLNNRMEEAEAKTKALDDAWQKAVDSAKNLRDAAGAIRFQQARDTTTNEAVAKDPGHEASIRRQAELAQQLLDLTVQKAGAERAIADIVTKAEAKRKEETLALSHSERTQENIMRITEQMHKSIDDNTEALRGQVATLADGINNIDKAKDGVKDWAKSQKDAADALERYNRALEASINKRVAAVIKSVDISLGQSQEDLLWKDLANGSKHPEMQPANDWDTHGQTVLGKQIDDEVTAALHEFSSLKDQMDLLGGAALKVTNGLISLSHAPDSVTTALDFAATAAGATAINLQAVGESSGEARKHLKELTDQINAAAEASAQNTASSIEAGHGFEMLGGALGKMAGTALGNMVAPGIGGAIGGGVGDVLGSLLGGMIDKLAPVGDLLQFVMDGLTNLVGALEPLFDPLRTLGRVIYMFLIGLAPLLSTLAKFAGPLVMIVVEIIAVFQPLIDVAANLLFGFLFMTPVLDLVGMGLDYLAKGLGMLVDVVYSVYDAFAGLVNTVVSWIRSIPGFEKFGSLMDANESFTQSGQFSAAATPDGRGLLGVQTSDMGAGLRNWLGAINHNTDALNASSRTLGNVPDAFKVVLSEYNAQDPVHRGGRHVTATDGSSNAGVTVYVGNERLTRTWSRAEQQLHNIRYGHMNEDPRWRSPGD